MSFDLYFYKRKDNQLTEEQVAEYLEDNIPHTHSEHPKQWRYENPATGVYFLMKIKRETFWDINNDNA